MRNVRKRLTALLVICLLLAQAAVPAAASAAGQERKRLYVFFEAGGEKNGFHSREPASVTLTAQVPQDGTYMLDLNAEGAQAFFPFDEVPATISSPDEALAMLNGREFYYADRGLYCLVELTAGEYTIQAEDACSVNADLTLVYPLESSVLGPIEEGVYFGTLDEAITVNYTVTASNAHADLYNGPAEEMYKVGSVMAWDHEDTGELDTGRTSVSFEPGVVVIDFQDFDHDGTLEGAAADMSNNEAAVLRGEPIEFVNASGEDDYGITSQSVDAPATGTATIQGDGCYFLDVDLTTWDEFTFSSDIPALPDVSAVPDWATTPAFLSADETRIYMVTDVAGGTYSMTIGNAKCYASFYPLQTLDSLTGEFERKGMYVCFLDAPATVTFAIDKYSVERVRFYGGAEEDGFLQILTPEMEARPDGMVEMTVQFPAGAAVIDTHSYNDDPITGVQSEKPA